MNEDRVEGAATNVGGKIKDAAGSLLGDSKLQAEGKSDRAQGTVQNAYGSAKDAIEDGVATLGSQLDDAIKNRPALVLLAAAGIGYLLRALTASPSRR